MAIQTGQSTYTPKSHDGTFHTGQTVNLLSALIPAFANWTQNPGTNADLVTELTGNALTTNGIGAAGNNTIIYDLGTSRRRIVRLRTDQLISVRVSDDGITYHNTGNTNPAGMIYQMCDMGKFRYLSFTLVGVLTITIFSARCYNLN